MKKLLIVLFIAATLVVIHLFFNAVRLTTINSTKHEIDYVLVMGLESQILPGLKAGESRTDWIFPHGRQRLVIQYPRINNAPAEAFLTDFDFYQGGSVKFEIKDDTVIQNVNTTRETVEVNEIALLVNGGSDNPESILLDNGDTLVEQQDYYRELEIKDINQDGHEDLRIFFLTSTPNSCYNYLFDPNSRTFKLIDNCFSDIEKLGTTDFYTYYEAIGCADYNWMNYLIKVENFAEVKYGVMEGLGCNVEEDSLSAEIKLYRIQKGKENYEECLATMPYIKYVKTNGDKWEFARNYWSANYRKFETR